MRIIVLLQVVEGLAYARAGQHGILGRQVRAEDEQKEEAHHLIDTMADDTMVTVPETQVQFIIS